MGKEVIVDLGCGNKKTPGSIGIDSARLEGIDIITDLNKRIPLKTSSVDRIIASNIIEHLHDVAKIMEEIHRIGKHGAIVEIEVPYYASHYAFCDPTHRHFFAWKTFDYFTEKEPFAYYSKARFEIIEKKFHSLGRGRIVKNAIDWVATKFPTVYERCLNSIVKIDTLRVKLKVIK